MNSNIKNAAIVILALTTIGAGVFAWRQYQRANALDTQVAALNKAAEERAGRGQRRASSERRQQNPEDGQAPVADDEQRAAREERRENMRAVWESPEAVKVRTAEQRRRLDARYAGLFKKLNLSPGQIEKVKDLLVEKQNAGRDVMSVAREQGLDARANRGEIRQLIQQTGAEIDANIASVLGADKFAQYQTYEQTGSQRAVVGTIEQQLSYTSDALTQSQSEQLVSLLAANTPASSDSGGPGGPSWGGGPMMMGGGYGGVEITDQVVIEAQSFLSAAQVEALRQLQSEQNDQKQLRELMTSAGGGEGRVMRGRRAR
ncbi:hypothetical protein [Ereboglobus luteus]|uniref:hypothetical protein n=1 Tax=Ereboglobus luteus TaxID=1796921 RepID=UPI001260210A|nr:hypothetical protein [Ereboglobus luteus]